MRCIMPPHCSQAGPSSRSAPIFAETTGGVSVSAAVAGLAADSGGGNTLLSG